MKVIKGCTNESCQAKIKKIKFKKNDGFCTHCGHPLHYVCADCWKQLDNPSEKYCIICKEARKDKTENRIDAMKEGVTVAGKLVVSIGGGAAFLAKNLKQIEGAGKTIIRVGKKAIKVIPKK